jgi:hypothetical protein
MRNNMLKASFIYCFAHDIWMDILPNAVCGFFPQERVFDRAFYLHRYTLLRCDFDKPSSLVLGIYPSSMNATQSS